METVRGYLGWDTSLGDHSNHLCWISVIPLDGLNILRIYMRLRGPSFQLATLKSPSHTFLHLLGHLQIHLPFDEKSVLRVRNHLACAPPQSSVATPGEFVEGGKKFVPPNFQRLVESPLSTSVASGARPFRRSFSSEVRDLFSPFPVCFFFPPPLLASRRDHGATGCSTVATRRAFNERRVTSGSNR